LQACRPEASQACNGNGFGEDANPERKHDEPTITTNGIRFQTDVLIVLIEEAMQGYE
jgi:hypothetical protein